MRAVKIWMAFRI